MEPGRIQQLRFRRADDGDVAALVDLVEGAYRGERSRQGWASEADLVGGQRVDAQMVAGSLASPDAVVIVAELDGELVACCELRRPARQGGAATLGMFAVDPTRQAGGFGRQVLEEGERQAVREWGAGAVELEVIDVRHELIDWYRRRGYLPTGEVRPFPYGDERFGIPLRDDLRFAVLEKQL